MTDRPGEVLRLPAFALFWSSSTLGALTGAVSALAFQVMIVKTLNATPLEIGPLNAANVVPYLRTRWATGRRSRPTPCRGG